MQVLMDFEDIAMFWRQIEINCFWEPCLVISKSSI